jgi:S1-C subfamily serine protease
MSNPALELSQAFAAAVETVGRHLVRIDDRATGVAWSPDLVVTVNHPLPEAERFSVELPDDRPVDATLVGRDAGTDLALLRVEGGGLAPARFADGSGARVGELLVAVGRSARGLRASLRLLASVGGEWQSRAGGRLERLLVTDTAPMPGFAGGVLARADGTALGISTGALARGNALAVPTATITRVVAALSKHGRVRRGFLGVGTLPVRLPQAIAEQTGQATALLVTGVQPGGPAEAAGILLGDALVTLDDQPTADVRALRALLSDDRIGQAISARVLRAGSVHELRITIGAHP